MDTTTLPRANISLRRIRLNQLSSLITLEPNCSNNVSTIIGSTYLDLFSRIISKTAVNTNQNHKLATLFKPSTMLLFGSFVVLSAKWRKTPELTGHVLLTQLVGAHAAIIPPQNQRSKICTAISLLFTNTKNTGPSATELHPFCYQ